MSRSIKTIRNNEYFVVMALFIKKSMKVIPY